MGTDYYPKTVIGIPVKPLLTYFYRAVELPVYNRRTGKLDGTEIGHEQGYTYKGDDYRYWNEFDNLETRLEVEYGAPYIRGGEDIDSGYLGFQLPIDGGVTFDTLRTLYETAVSVLGDEVRIYTILEISS